MNSKLRSNPDIQISVRVDSVNSIYGNKLTLEEYMHHLVERLDFMYLTLKYIYSIGQLL